MTTETTKALNIAIRQYYPGAFVSYRGTIFRVTSSQPGLLSGISDDPIETEKANDVLDDYPELIIKAYRIIENKIREDIGITLPNTNKRKLNIKVPGKIDLRIDDKLDRFYCQNPQCGTMTLLGWNKHNDSELPNCKLCNGKILQAPIFLPINRKHDDNDIDVGSAGIAMEADIRPYDKRQMFCHYLTRDNKCMAPTSKDKKCVDKFDHKLGSLIQFDYMKPIESLMRCNPDCPKELSVPSKKILRPRNSGDYWFKLDFPKVSLNRPLTATAVVSYSNTYDIDAYKINEMLDTTFPNLFNSNIVDLNNTKFTNMKILETVYGYILGGANSGIITTYVTADSKTVIGRVTDTKGIEITIKREIYDLIKNINDDNYENYEILEIILHSLKHALLIDLPLFTGLDENMFHGAYEINYNENEDWAGKVFIYDVESGGNGGLSTIMRNKHIIQKLFYDIQHNKLQCKVRECSNACKHCLFIRNCGMINKKLNRHLLIKSKIFNQNEDY